MKLYVSTYKKYNEGSLFGKWMDLDDFSDKEEFLEACRELHKDEKDPELMFQDIECEYEWEHKLYSECCVPEEYWEIKEELEKNGNRRRMLRRMAHQHTGNTMRRPHPKSTRRLHRKVRIGRRLRSKLLRR